MSDNQLPIPDFVDVDASAVAAAEGAANERAAGGSRWTLPEGVTLSAPSGKNNARHGRWAETFTITAAYRSVTKKGLLDVVIMAKPRTGSPNEANGNGFLHFYLNTAVMNGTATEEQKKSHERMTNEALGVLSQLIRITGFMPQSNRLGASLLSTLFPPKGQLGAKSPLDGKSAVARMHLSETPKKVTNEETGEITDVVDTRLEVDAFLPEPKV